MNLDLEFLPENALISYLAAKMELKFIKDKGHNVLIEPSDLMERIHVCRYQSTPQLNTFDCGIFTIMNTEKILLNYPKQSEIMLVVKPLDSTNLLNLE